MDYIGQGSSWPPPSPSIPLPSLLGVRYSGETWLSQVSSFIETVVLPSSPTSKISLAGNSLGGYLAVHYANLHPTLVDSITLFNPSPYWGGTLSRIWGSWDGTLPSPSPQGWLGSSLYDIMCSPFTVSTFLKNCYANVEASDKDDVGGRIMEAASDNHGHEAFTSMLFSPSLPGSFNTLLREPAVQGTRCLLIYGDADPWISPRFGRSLIEGSDLKSLGGEMWVVENGGHCCNHEFAELVVGIMGKFGRGGEEGGVFEGGEEAWGGGGRARRVA